MNRDELALNYAASNAFGASLGIGTRQALVMVDFARAYFERESPLFANTPEVLAQAAALLDWARKRGWLVCHTRVRYDARGLDGGVFFRKIPALRVFCEGNPLGEFASGLAPAEGEPVVTKQYASAFFGTSLASTLRAQGIDCTVIAGMSTSGCVRATALDAIQHGFIPVVVSDACGDRHEQPHQANLFDLQAKYADVMPLARLQELVGA
ncbi:MAG TPA: isochorismatase family protein [Ramlibacter sp.]|uniref:isochorismatase family protein n=1 Tax=Ramlibacter sp. TaxID=1917967 RepID=UPI002D7E2C12|nr:isochorismatase family protein [Ramlibacter sp.]HET8746822.1 isochorismatase family protein [Ramlibacter sp.]